MFKFNKKKIAPTAKQVGGATAGYVAADMAVDYLEPHVADYGGEDTANGIVGAAGIAVAASVSGNDTVSTVARSAGVGAGIRAGKHFVSKYIIDPLFTPAKKTGMEYPGEDNVLEYEIEPLELATPQDVTTNAIVSL